MISQNHWGKEEERDKEKDNKERERQPKLH
jgi:hypothetical protein